MAEKKAKQTPQIRTKDESATQKPRIKFAVDKYSETLKMSTKRVSTAERSIKKFEKPTEQPRTEKTTGNTRIKFAVDKYSGTLTAVEEATKLFEEVCRDWG